MAGLLKRQLTESPDAQSVLADIIKEAKMANVIVQEVLAFVRPIRLQVEDIAVADVIRDAITMAESWNIAAGYAGQVNLGHAAFFGLGALVARTLWIKGTPIVLAMLGSGVLARGCARSPVPRVARPVPLVGFRSRGRSRGSVGMVLRTHLPEKGTEGSNPLPCL